MGLAMEPPTPAQRIDGATRSAAARTISQDANASIFPTAKFQSDPAIARSPAAIANIATAIHDTAHPAEREAQAGTRPPVAAGTPSGADVPLGPTSMASAAPSAVAMKALRVPVNDRGDSTIRSTNSPKATASAARVSQRSRAAGRADIRDSARITDRIAKIAANATR